MSNSKGKKRKLKKTLEKVVKKNPKKIGKARDEVKKILDELEWDPGYIEEIEEDRYLFLDKGKCVVIIKISISKKQPEEEDIKKLREFASKSKKDASILVFTSATIWHIFLSKPKDDLVGRGFITLDGGQEDIEDEFLTYLHKDRLLGEIIARTAIDAELASDNGLYKEFSKIENNDNDVAILKDLRSVDIGRIVKVLKSGVAAGESDYNSLSLKVLDDKAQKYVEWRIEQENKKVGTPSGRSATGPAPMQESTESRSSTAVSEKPTSSGVAKSPSLDPQKISVLGEEILVESYREIWMKVAEKVLARLGDKFFETVVSNWEKPQVFESKDDLPPTAGPPPTAKLRRIGDSRYWINMLLNGFYIITYSKKLLTAVGLSEDDLRVYDKDGHEIVVGKEGKLKLVILDESASSKVGSPASSTAASVNNTKGKSKSTPEPSTILILGETVKLEKKKWIAVWVEVCKHLYARHGDDFIVKMCENWDGKSPPVSLQKADFPYGCKKLPGSNPPLWVNTRLNALSKLDYSQRALVAIGHLESDLKIYNKTGAELVIGNGEIVLKSRSDA